MRREIGRASAESGSEREAERDMRKREIEIFERKERQRRIFPSLTVKAGFFTLLFPKLSQIK